MEVCKEEQEGLGGNPGPSPVFLALQQVFSSREHYYNSDNPGMTPDKVFLRSLFMWVNSRVE